MKKNSSFRYLVKKLENFTDTDDLKDYLRRLGFKLLSEGSEKTVYHKLGCDFVVKVHEDNIVYDIPVGCPEHLHKYFLDVEPVSDICHIQEKVKLVRHGTGCLLENKMKKIFEGLEVESNHYDSREDEWFPIEDEIWHFNIGYNSIGRPVLVDC